MGVWVMVTNIIHTINMGNSFKGCQCCGGCRQWCCKDACLCCQTTPCCGNRCMVCCRDLLCRDFYARPPIVRTLQPVGAMSPAPVGGPALAVSQVSQRMVTAASPVMQQTTTTNRFVELGPGIMVSPPHQVGPPVQVGPTVIRTSTVSASGGPVVDYGGPIVPRDPRVPMAGVDMY